MDAFHQHIGNRRNSLRPLVWGAAAVLLLLPLVAMQFTSEVNWTLFDFAVFGMMLLGACSAYELAARASGSKAYRLAAGIAVVGVFLQVWANLAVGIIGNESNPANLMFLAIPMVGVLGAVLARFKPSGMARTLVAMAITQVLIWITAWAWVGANVLVVTIVFVMIWLMSAGLFRQAASSS